MRKLQLQDRTQPQRLDRVGDKAAKAIVERDKTTKWNKPWLGLVLISLGSGRLTSHALKLHVVDSVSHGCPHILNDFWPNLRPFMLCYYHIASEFCDAGAGCHHAKKKSRPSQRRHYVISNQTRYLYIFFRTIFDHPRIIFVARERR